MSKALFLLKQMQQMWLLTENNCNSATVRTVWKHIQTKLGDLLNASAVNSTTYFEQRGVLHQDYQPCWPKHCQDTWARYTMY